MNFIFSYVDYGFYFSSTLTTPALLIIQLLCSDFNIGFNYTFLEKAPWGKNHAINVFLGSWYISACSWLAIFFPFNQNNSLAWVNKSTFTFWMVSDLNWAIRGQSVWFRIGWENQFSACQNTSNSFSTKQNNRNKKI